ncbi:MAG: MltA domain-containing protein [Pseudorhodoplanes sp.]
MGLSSLSTWHAPKLLGALAALALLIAPVSIGMSQARAETKPESKLSEIKKKVKAKIKRIFAKAHPLKIPNSQVDPLAWHEIAGWMEDDHSEAFATFLASCRPILKSSAKSRAERGETYRVLYDVCGRAMSEMPLDGNAARAFFEMNFRPISVAANGEKEGFFTGYYEPVVEGARYPSDIYTTPLYRRPNDMVTQRLRRSGKKAQAGKKVVKKSTAAYFDRGQIEDGVLAGRDLEIAYVKSPIDAFFAEIQGSVRVRLEDGSVIRLNYAAANGHPYFAVGSVLVQKGIVPREEMSMQKIREYMEKFPEEGKELRRMNRSFVFFRETDLTEFEEAIGAQGISLTAARSIAVDRKIHTYGMPVFVNALLPIASEKPDTWFRRLMIAQDTGGAIVGPARADIYLGAGSEAERAAGRFKHNGQFVMLIPNELDPEDEALGTRLPQPRPKEGVLSNMMSLFSKPKPDKDAEPAAEEPKPNAAGAPAAVLPAAVVPLPKQKPAAKSEAAVKPEAVKPQPVAAKPETAKPQPVAAKPETAKPQPAAARPDAAAKPPVAAKPETPGKPQTAARSDTRPEASPKPKPAPKPEIAAKPDPAAKPQTNPGARPDGGSKPNTAAKNGNPFPKPAGVAPPPPPPAPPPRTPSDVR